VGFFKKIGGALKGWAKSYGRFQPSRSVTEMFRQGQVLPELAYYHIGSAAAPEAILALERSRVLESRRWKPLAVETDELLDRVKRMAFHAIDGQGPTGWRILDPAGEAIGIAYSPGKSAVQVKADGRVVVHLPDMPIAKR
jgi:hypothetical protein